MRTAIGLDRQWAEVQPEFPGDTFTDLRGLRIEFRRLSAAVVERRRAAEDARPPLVLPAGRQIHQRVGRRDQTDLHGGVQQLADPRRNSGPGTRRLGTAFSPAGALLTGIVLLTRPFLARTTVFAGPLLTARPLSTGTLFAGRLLLAARPSFRA
ncbi:hypothetical protein [Amycolatopsis sp. PS_44_ISF1]|uniref:hypothetical protein n=1 Tax=Amycolatopsis sp. PS_44_ISF1 TaxID=2974917 RepID=UPI0028DFF78C|nr:hypothetical protein [Amycolatopsis sp. PS_44_ISF1]MDT8912079.1 hypothetical protein [Amycolatopsis sp. PS_44_ISF1]